MAGRPKPQLKEEDVRGFKYLDLILPLLKKLHDHACEQARAPNRKRHDDEYISLLLLHVFNPMMASLRSIQQASQLKTVQEKLGCPRSSLGSLSEAARVFDPDVLIGIIADLAGRVPVLNGPAPLRELKGILTRVDGTVLKALPKRVEALWLDEEHRAFKRHTPFQRLTSVPVRMDLTAATGAERADAAAPLAKRFSTHGESIFRFLFDPAVPPTNNTGEQGIRGSVIDRRITQSSRLLMGRQWNARIWTVLGSCRKQRRSAWQFIQEALNAHHFGHGSKTGTGTSPEPVLWVVVEGWLGGESPFLNHTSFRGGCAVAGAPTSLRPERLRNQYGVPCPRFS